MTLLGLGLAAIYCDLVLGWLPILAASAIAILAGTTGFSFVTLFYAIPKEILRGLVLRRSESGHPSSAIGNPRCAVCRSLGAAPYHRCLWCNLPTVRSCCGIQTSMILALLLVISFLLTAALEPLITKLLVTMSIVAVVALALAITRQADDLVDTLDGLEEEHQGAERRCAFLKRLALAGSIQAAAEETVAYVEANVAARRVSLMLAEDDVLRVTASRASRRRSPARWPSRSASASAAKCSPAAGRSSFTTFCRSGRMMPSDWRALVPWPRTRW